MLSNQDLEEYLTIKNSGNLTDRICLRINDQEKAMIDKFKNETGISVSEIVRRSLYNTIK